MEARAAADSALWGQHSARMAARYSAMYALRSQEAAALRSALAASDSTITAQRQALDAWELTDKIWRSEARRMRWKGTGRTVLWGVGAGLAGVVVGVVATK